MKKELLSAQSYSIINCRCCRKCRCEGKGGRCIYGGPFYFDTDGFIDEEKYLDLNYNLFSGIKEKSWKERRENIKKGLYRNLPKGLKW